MPFSGSTAVPILAGALRGPPGVPLVAVASLADYLSGSITARRNHPVRDRLFIPTSRQRECRQGPRRPREGVAMEPLHWMLLIGLAAVLAMVGGYFAARYQDHLQVSSARASRDEILSQARLEADNLKKEAELKVKDTLLKEREKFSKDVEGKNAEIREQERRLEKKEDSLEQRHQA